MLEFGRAAQPAGHEGMCALHPLKQRPIGPKPMNCNGTQDLGKASAVAPLEG